MPLPLLAMAGIGAALGAAGGAMAPKDKTTTTTQTRDPYGPSQSHIDRILAEAGGVYGSQGPYPTMDLSGMWKRLGGGGGGGGGGGAAASSGGGGKRGGGGGGGGGHMGAVKRFENLAQQTPEQIAQAFDYAGGVMGGPDLNPYYQQYLDMEDLNTDSEIFRRIRESIGRSTEEDMNQYLGAAGQAQDMAGMFGSSVGALERAGTRGQFADALSDAILNAQLGLRGQQMGLMDMIGGQQMGAAGLVPSLEQARLMGPQAAAEMGNMRKIQAMQNSGQMAVARLNADTQRALQGAALGQQNKEWQYAQALGLTGMEHQNALAGYNNPWAQLGQYQSTVLPIASGFGTQTSRSVQPGSRGANMLQGALGGAMGFGGLFG